MNLVDKGSQIAKNGFKNEDDVVKKFNNWRKDSDAKNWLSIMRYSLDEIEYVKAEKLSGYKTDVQVQVSIKLKKGLDVENLQVKLVSNMQGFNQIDKRRVDTYAEMWNLPEKVVTILKKYTGEILPTIKNPRDERRMFADEFRKVDQKIIITWLTDNKGFIVSDILKGRGKLAAEWMLVAQKIDKDSRWVLKPMNYCMNFFAQGDVEITKKGNFKIGRITMQRKGGDGGRDTAKMLQFKINPAELFK